MSIQLLSSDVVTMMAAGEVIHRPADILKELLENSLDAQADKIEIDLMQGGKERIKVIDNGIGIPATELENAIRAHATSKLKSLDDLQQVQTYGFRGEALHAIAHVSNFTLASRVKSEDFGTQLCIQSPNRVVSKNPFAIEQGTIVQANQIFVPYPVRRKFLKSPRLEFGRCLKVLQAMAIAHPEKEFICYHNSRREFFVKKNSDCSLRLEEIFQKTKNQWSFFEKKFDRGLMQLWYCPIGTKGYHASTTSWPYA